MTSDTKGRANEDSTNAPGPKTKAGNQRVRLNALKEGIFAKELIVKDNEKPEFEALRSALHQQYAASTPMQQIGFDRIVCCAWWLKLSIRREMRRLNAHLDLQTPHGPLVEDPEEKAQAPRWYGFGRAGLRAAERMLLDLRQDIQATGWIHAEQWKEPLSETFGNSEFYDSLTEWDPGSIDAILAAEHLVAHSKTYNLPLPELQEAGNSNSAIGDPRSRWQMMVKLVDVKLQQLNDFRRLLDERSAGEDSQTTASADIAGRYVTTASRELERAVAWYEHLKEHGR